MNLSPTTTRSTLVVRYTYDSEPRIDRLDGSRHLFTMDCPFGVVVILGNCFAATSVLSRAIENIWRTASTQALSSLPGCFSMILLRSQRVLALPDPVGQFPLYLISYNDGVLIGSRASDLADTAKRRPDPSMLAAHIACPDILPMFGSRTAFCGISRILPGAVLSLDASGSRILNSGDPTMRTARNRADVVAELRDCLLDSIQARKNTANHLSADLSGGLDSTSLAFLAAQDTDAIHCFTSTSSSAMSDDLRHALRYVRANSSLLHHVVYGSESDLPFQDLTAKEDGPCVASLFRGPLRARLAAAMTFGSDFHLVGEGGDVLFGAPPVYLADLARDGHPGLLWRHCVAWARLRARSPLSLYRRALVLGAQSSRQSLRSLARSIDGGCLATNASWEADWISCWQQPHSNWLTVRARHRLADEIVGIADRTDRDTHRYGDLVTRNWLHLQCLTQRAIRNTGAELGIEVHAPFLDTPVVRAALALPAHRRVDLDTPKPLLRHALSGLVPDAVLSRPTKGSYVADAFRGVRRAAPALRQLFDNSAAGDYGLLEPGQVRKVLEDAIQGLPTPWGSLSQAVAVELWLRTVPERTVA